MIPTLPITTDTDLEADVLVIGSGAGGATSALMLAEAGLSVVILEEGLQHQAADFNGGIADMMAMLYRDSGMTPIMGKPTIAFAEGRCLGGSTVINGALFWRAPDKLLLRWENELGFPGVGPEALAPHYDVLETDMKVATQQERTTNRNSWTLTEACDRLGWRWEYAPRAQAACHNSNRCPSGCPNNAKQSMLISMLPRAVSAGARIVCSAKTKRIIHRNGRAEGAVATVTEEDGRSHRLMVRAKTVFVCGGPMQSPHLLRASGIAQGVGEGLHIHLNLKAVALFPDDMNPGAGTIMAAQVKEFSDRDLFIGASNFDPVYLALTLTPHGPTVIEQVLADWRHASIYVGQVKASATGHVRHLPGLDRPMPSYRVNDVDLVNLRFTLERMTEVLFAAGARIVYLPLAGSGPLASQSEARRLLARPIPPKALDLLSVHAMASCGLGRALDLWGRVKGFDNLLVNDAAMLPEATGVNPQMTIMAMARRNVRAFLDHKG